MAVHGPFAGPFGQQAFDPDGNPLDYVKGSVSVELDFAAGRSLKSAQVMGIADVSQPFWAGGAALTRPDNQVAVQAAMDFLALNRPFQGGRILVPEQYPITAPVLYRDSRYAGLGLIGLGRERSGFTQNTNNVPIVQFQGEDTHSWLLQDLAFKYGTNQPTGNTGAQAINFNKVGAIGNGWYFWMLKRCKVVGAQVAIGMTGSGSLSCWNYLVDDFLMSAISHRLIDMTSPVPIGMPIGNWRRITYINGGVATGDTYAVAMQGAPEVAFDGLDIEDWADKIFILTGGSPATIRNMHLERLLFPLGSSGNMFAIADSGCSILDSTVSGTMDAGVGVTFFNAFTAGGRINISRMNFNMAIANVGNFAFIGAVAGAKIKLQDIVRTGGTVFPIIPANAAAQGAVVAQDNIFQPEVAQDIAFAANITPDPTLGAYVRVGTLTGALTVNNPATLAPAGTKLIFRFTHDATANVYAIAWGNQFKRAGGAFANTNAANAVDTISFEHDGTVFNERSRAINVS